MKFAFVFSGQGTQYVGMGKDICKAYEPAKKIFQKADEVLGWSLSELCFNGPEDKLTESKYCQPAIFTVSCACLEAFKSLYPDLKSVSAAGLSLGEFASLYCAGVFSFNEGLKLVAKRGELMDEACKMSSGAMLTVLGAQKEIVAKICADADVDMANLNCPGQIVISGEASKIAKANELLKNAGIKKLIPLKVAGAYHSRLMGPAAAKFAEILSGINLNSPQLAVIQNVTGKTVSSSEEIRENLAKQVSGTVHWQECVLEIASNGADTIIEFGPGNVLTGLVKRIKPELKTYNINSAKSLEEFKTFIS